MAARITGVVKRRKALSAIFQIRARAVRELDSQRDDLYNNAIEDLKDAVEKLEAA